MTSPQPSQAERVQRLRIIHVAFVASVFIYSLVLIFVTRQPGDAGDISILRPVLIVAAALSAGGSIWWRRRATGETQFMPLEKTGGADSLDQLEANCIITWAFSESVAIYGLVLGFLSRDPGSFMPFGAAALVLLAIHRPGSAVWPQWPPE
jgi:F0F1-type ATP synthase membrane subunit c/vacuolar-type H+-ATPase subunit K